MSKIRTTTLELQRHGPPNNQLLSPLTQYLALAGNHPPETVHIPLEHQQMLMRLQTLRYNDSSETLEMQLEDTAALLSEVLGEVPGLIADLSDMCPGSQDLTHLELVLSASELALLPFELAYAPRGAPDAGQHLALQSRLPMTVTRKTRRVTTEVFEWPRHIRILFVAASPGEVGEIPLASHLLAFRRLLDPWIGYHDDPDTRWRQLERRLVVLPRASLRQIEEACQRSRFSHVHILTHGVPYKKVGGERFGLALHQDGRPELMDVVDGRRLATALRAFSTHSCGNSRPAVVTLASCDSGHVGSVLSPGGSIAHALHEAGIPLVIGSQFPLSFAGSVWMVERLYEDLLQGEDPRRSLARLRRHLHTQVPERHDWASLVAYAALPSDLEEQLGRFRVQQANTAAHTALDWTDSLLVNLRQTDPATQQHHDNVRSIEREVQGSLQRLQSGKERLYRLAREGFDVSGLLASVFKREAQVLYEAWSLLDSREASGMSLTSTSSSYREDSREALEQARFYYREAFERDLTASWAVAQYLSLSEVLSRPDPDRRELWTFARLASEVDVKQRSDRRLAWAHSTLAELYLLAELVWWPDPPPLLDHRALARQHAASLGRMERKHWLDIYTTRRQILRYGEWFPYISRRKTESKIQDLLPTVEEMLGLLPEVPPVAADHEEWLDGFEY